MSGSLPPYVPEFFASMFGLIVGSFANVCIYRIPLDQSIVFPASRCPRCFSAIAPSQNLPIVSWLFLRGRCAACQEPISGRYPAVEAIHGAGFGAIAHTFGVTPFTPVLCVFFSALVILALIDWDHLILPDVITLPGIVVGIASTFVPGALVSWKESALSAALGFVAFFLVACGFSWLRKIDGLGMGDWKLAAMMGAFMGGRPLLLVVFLGSLSGMVYGLVQAFRLRGQARQERSSSDESPDSNPLPAPPSEPGTVKPLVDEHVADEEEAPIGLYKLPFGTFLAASAVVVLFFGGPLLDWYGSFFRF